MANMSGVIPYEFDKLLELKAPGSITVDTDTAVRKLQSDGAYWQGHRDVKNGSYDVVLLVTEVTGTFVVELKTGSDASKSNPLIQLTLAVPGPGRYVLPVNETALVDVDADGTHWWLTFNVTTSANVHAFIAPRARDL